MGVGGGGLRAQVLLMEHEASVAYGCHITQPARSRPPPPGIFLGQERGKYANSGISVSGTLVPRSFQRAGKPQPGWGFPPISRAWCPATGPTCLDLQRDPELPKCWAPHLAPLGLMV